MLPQFTLAQSTDVASLTTGEVARWVDCLDKALITNFLGADFRKYEASNAELRAQPNDGQRVVFFGNSITENWGRMRPEFFSQNGYICRGISGQTSYQFLVRFREDAVSLHPEK